MRAYKKSHQGAGEVPRHQNKPSKKEKKKSRQGSRKVASVCTERKIKVQQYQSEAGPSSRPDAPVSLSTQAATAHIYKVTSNVHGIHQPWHGDIKASKGRGTRTVTITRLSPSEEGSSSDDQEKKPAFIGGKIGGRKLGVAEAREAFLARFERPTESKSNANTVEPEDIPDSAEPEISSRPKRSTRQKVATISDATTKSKITPKGRAKKKTGVKGKATPTTRRRKVKQVSEKTRPVATLRIRMKRKREISPESDASSNDKVKLGFYASSDSFSSSDNYDSSSSGSSAETSSDSGSYSDSYIGKPNAKRSRKDN